MTEEKTDKAHEFHAKYGIGEHVYWCDSELCAYNGMVNAVHFNNEGVEYVVSRERHTIVETIPEASLFADEHAAKVHAGEAMMRRLQDKMVKLARFMEGAANG